MIKLIDLSPINLKECDDCERDAMDWTHGHDHEASMADSELRDMISNASKIQNMVEPGDELPGWVSAYITLAADYMHSVAEYMEGKMQEKGAETVPSFAIYEISKKNARKQLSGHLQAAEGEEIAAVKDAIKRIERAKTQDEIVNILGEFGIEPEDYI